MVFLVGVVLYYRQRRKEEEQLMYAMVEKITCEFVLDWLVGGAGGRGGRDLC